MSRYRRLVVPGGTYFFTVRLEDRSSDLLVREVALLRDSVRLCRRCWPFAIDVAVILPDHLHMIWTLPHDDGDFSRRWRLIKSTFSRHVEAPARRSRSKAERGEKGIWQRRFWEHRIRDAADFAAHRGFALTAPVRAGLVARPQDWALSSLHRDLAAGLRLPSAVSGGYGPVARERA
ncbi:MAG: transposase [Rhodobacteraceae bacterium]|nr:transposase [Paracoccaceae bacterium]